MAIPLGAAIPVLASWLALERETASDYGEAMALWREAVNSWATLAIARNELISGILETDHDAVSVGDVAFFDGTRGVRTSGHRGTKLGSSAS